MNTFLTIVLVIAGIIGTIAVLLHASDKSLKKLARKHMAGRPRLSSSEFGKKFYPDHAEVAGRVRDIMAQYLPVDLSQLEPSDQPVKDLRMDALDSMSTVEFVIALEEKFGITIADADAEKLRTFDNICQYVIAGLEDKNVDNKGMKTDQ